MKLKHYPKEYFYFSIACIAGYIWVILNEVISLSNGIGVCLFKKATSIPCPSCGSTRAVMLLIDGKVFQAILYNPIGLLIFSIMLTLPFWIVYDLLAKKTSLLKFYKKMEAIMNKKIFFVPFIILVLSNWIWNICKGL